ncbi:universal stress protein [Halomicrococcus gelatinilyticus]|uniref:universal stress protein n=1 Tax=Halomicrococcus gelatinilyticus TaxID=1702103 RepID=UPI002E11ADCC
MYDRILVPTDGSEVAANAAARAFELAAAFDAELHVLSVANPNALAPDARTPRITGRLEREAEKVVGETASRARQHGVDSVTAEARLGTPHSAILDYADEHDVDLVVMGTQGRTGLRRHLLGSVTAKVVRLSDVPVLTVRRPAEATAD